MIRILLIVYCLDIRFERRIWVRLGLGVWPVAGPEPLAVASDRSGASGGVADGRHVSSTGALNGEWVVPPRGLGKLLPMAGAWRKAPMFVAPLLNVALALCGRWTRQENRFLKRTAHESRGGKNIFTVYARAIKW